MTILSDTELQEVEREHRDVHPGSTDVEWAEEAFRRPTDALPFAKVRAVVRARRHPVRAAIVAGIILAASLAAGLTLTSTSSSGPTTPRQSSAVVSRVHPALSVVEPRLQVPFLTRPSSLLPLEPPLRVGAWH